MKQASKLFCTAMLMLALAISALAQDNHKDHKDHGKHEQAKAATAKNAFLGKGDGVTTCPVTGEELTNKDIKADFYGRTVYFCCPGCLAKAQAAPASYIKKTHAEQLAAVKSQPKAEAHDHGAMAAKQAGAKGEAKFLGKGDGVETCPVTGEPVNKNVKAEINGRTVYACCEGCLATVKKSPELYLKPEAKKETAFLGKGDGIETCPVTGEKVDKKFKGEVNGQTFYVCCEGCIDTVKANPAAYLKAAKK